MILSLYFAFLFIKSFRRTYLAAQRNYRKLHDEYNSKGERSVEETAKIVGFKLPHDPK